MPIDELEELVKREDLPLDVKKKLEIARAKDLDRDDYVKQVEHRSIHDALTSLPNRFLYHDRLEQAVKKASRDMLRKNGKKAETTETSMALLYIDIDNFKILNDAYTHDGGDEIIKYVGEQIKKSLRQSDTVARVGGDEYVAILPEIKTREHAEKKAKKIQKNMQQEPFEYKGKKIAVNISMGISLYPIDGKKGKTLEKRADNAMYKAKKLGGNQYQFHSQANP